MQRDERQGVSPEEQCKHRPSEKGGKEQLCVTQVVAATGSLLAGAGADEMVVSWRSVEGTDAEGGLHKEQ